MKEETLSKATAEILGEKEVITLKARIAFTLRKEIKGSIFNQIAFGGVGLTVEDVEYNEKGSWEMIACDIIIIPRERKVMKDSSPIKNGRIDHIMQCLNNDKYWKTK